MEILELFRKNAASEAFSANEVIFNEGDEGETMYVITEGEVEILVAGRILLTVGKGDILGEMALIENTPRSATAIAKTDCKLIPVNRNHFAELVQKNPMFSIHVMRVLADRVRRMNDLIRV